MTIIGYLGIVLLVTGCDWPCVPRFGRNPYRELQVCDIKERELWIGNSEFTARLQYCSATHLAVPDPVAGCMTTHFTRLSQECGRCLGEGSQCAAMYCMVPCIINQGSPECRACFMASCQNNLLACTGARDASELPVPPVDTGSVTTAAPKVRTRPPPKTTQAPGLQQ
jgi:hypothetical protein